MTPPETTRDLHLAGVYRREVRASLDRIWENVFDWEHLNYLHESSFAECLLIAKGRWGWRVSLTLAGSGREFAQTIEMRADRANGRYTSTTIDGTGAGTQIRVVLTPTTPQLTAVVVEFHVPEVRADRLAALGAAYILAYEKLWDEDEAMMQAREHALADRAAARTAGPLSVDLGEVAKVRADLPLEFDLGGGRYRLVDVEGALIAHSAVCPHWLGPLDDAPVVDGRVRCPWHGYVFDVRSGMCLSAKTLSLTSAPVVTLSNGRIYAAAAALPSVSASAERQKHEMGRHAE